MPDGSLFLTCACPPFVWRGAPRIPHIFFEETGAGHSVCTCGTGCLSTFGIIPHPFAYSIEKWQYFTKNAEGGSFEF